MLNIDRIRYSIRNVKDTVMEIFRNESGKSFVDISSEVRRVYEFAENNKTVEITAPLRLNVSENGHRIFDESGRSHYIPNGWVHLWWETKENKPHFVA